MCKKFEINKKDTVILKDINLEIKEQDIFGIVGDTGSGKSTILRLINGFIKPDKGDVFIMDELLDFKTKRTLVKDISVIFQNYNLLNNFNVINNVLLPVKLRKEDSLKKKEEAINILNYVGLRGFENEKITNLSGGQKQRVAIARSLITSPKILLCDEPTSALDQSMSIEILKLLKNINSEFGTTIVIISHDIEVIKNTCNKVAILEDGKISDVLINEQKLIKSLSYKERLLND